MVLMDLIIYWVLIIILMVRLSVVIKLLMFVFFWFVNFSVVLWLMEVWIKGKLSVMFMLWLKFWYFSMGRFWLWYIVSIVLVWLRYFGWKRVFVGSGLLRFIFFVCIFFSIGMMVFIFFVFIWLFLLVCGLSL